MKVFVTDGDEKPSLAVTRSLGKRGISVLVGEERGSSLASASKYCAGRVVYPSPYRDPEGFSRFLLNFVRESQMDLIVPMTDVTTYLTSRMRKELEPYTRIPIAEFDAFNFVSNKWSLLKDAEERGIPIPSTIFIERPEEIKEALDRLDYPVVVKPGRSRILEQGKWLLTRVHYAETEAKLIRLYQEKEYLRYPSLLQERIVGPGVGLFVLFDRGDLVTAFSHQRLREKPPSGGVSVLSQSIPVDPRLREHAIQLFKPLKWHGVAMLEYKLDQKTGKSFLIEVNGRFWGSLQLAIDAGVDFPYLLSQLMVEGQLESQKPYRVGVKSRWLLGDLDHLLLRLFKKEEDLSLPPDFPSKIKTLVQFMNFFDNDTYFELNRWGDLRPFFFELKRYLRQVMGMPESAA